MSNQDGLIDTEGLDQCPDVVGEREDVVAASGTRRFTIAAKVRRVEASVAQRFHCRPPTHPSFGKSVEAEDRRRIVSSCDRHVEGDAVGRYAPVLDVYRHRFSIALNVCLKADMQTGNGAMAHYYEYFYNSVLRLPQQISFVMAIIRDGQ